MSTMSGFKNHKETKAKHASQGKGIEKSLPGCLVSSVPSGPSRQWSSFVSLQPPRSSGCPDVLFKDVHSLCPPFYCPVSSTLQFGVKIRTKGVKCWKPWRFASFHEKTHVKINNFTIEPLAFLTSLHVSSSNVQLE